jgi:hypothetical protein
MMGLITAAVARQMTAERQRTAERAHLRPSASTVVGPKAMRRQRARVHLSLLLVPNRRESAAKEAE